MYVLNAYGVKIDWDTAVSLMDNQCRDILHNALVLGSDFACTPQQFFDAYCIFHEVRFHKEWELAKENPVY